MDGKESMVMGIQPDFSFQGTGFHKPNLPHCMRLVHDFMALDAGYCTRPAAVLLPGPGASNVANQ
ncbi:hypothetical protein B0W47_15740 [Komagataeibacter nataicola]|uniref:Uncharacterized protein n=1 Tax=Komagataeibacter nataicola TaxID=265960 RepID=A0A9N7H2D2_9PROT|nr:hypothetical protein B0W47_15740 [Komagataeibacter nataicola]